MSQNKYNWKEIFEYYNAEHTAKDCCQKFGCSISAFTGNVKRYNFKTRSQSEAAKLAVKQGRLGKPIPQAVREKISKSRIKYLEENPDKVPYLLNHSSKISWPEKLFQDALIKRGIKGWEYNFRNGIYAYDFAFPEIKLDVEIDGATHTTEKVKKIDARRDAWSKSKGWKVIRFTAKEVMSDVNKCIDFLGLKH